ncbi:MAG: DUF4258 domain-containing protein [Chitinophagaceae bacterium]
MKKALPYIFLGILVIAALTIKRCKNNNVSPSVITNPTQNTDRNNGLDRRVSYLEYTQHARCRMDCRQITEEEVKYILQNGTINYRKSEANGHPCPTYALEGYSLEKQHLRIVFAQCDYKTKVVTCIDLDHEFECHCPGDNNKHEQR